MKLQIYIRVDGSLQIGLGHLVRCISLAYMLRDNFRISFVCKEIPDAVSADIVDNDFQLLNISDEEQFFELLSEKNIVVLDGYNFDIEYQKQIKTIGSKLVCIDDLHDIEFVADLIINHAPGIAPHDYKSSVYTQFALGLQYALLRPKFIEQAKLQRKIDKIQTLIICFGGSDFKNLTLATLNTVLQFNELSKIIVITGAAYQFFDELSQIITTDNRIDYRHNQNEKQMLDAMLESDLAIVPASGILLEIMSTGCFVITGMCVDNQKFIYDNFVKLGNVIDGGQFDKESLESSIAYILNDYKSENSKVIDGKSDFRINKLFQQLENDMAISVRRANSSDLDLTFTWATNPKIRQFSFSQHQITYEEHSKWFLNKLKYFDSFYYILEFKNKAIGSIRFDIDDNEALISYLLDPLYHGHDLGLLLLKNGLKALENEVNLGSVTIKKLSGYVMKQNVPSVKAFEKLGFMKTENDGTLKFTKEI